MDSGSIGTLFTAVLIGLYGFGGWLLKRQSDRRKTESIEQDVAIQAVRTECASIRSENENLKNELTTVSGESKALEALTVEQSKKILGLEKQLSTEKQIQEHVMADLSAKIKDQENELSAVKTELASTKHELAGVNAQFVNLSKQRDDLADRVKALSNEVKELNTKLLQSEARADAFKSVIDVFSAKLTIVQNGDKVGTGELKPVEPVEAKPE